MSDLLEDLDALLGMSTASSTKTQEESSVEQDGGHHDGKEVESDICGDKLWIHTVPENSSVMLVPILFDDSGSIETNDIVEPLFKSFRKAVHLLEEISQKSGKDMLITVKGFGSKTYFTGPIEKLLQHLAYVLSKIDFEHRTPIISTSINIVEETYLYERWLAQHGITVDIVAMLVLTDGVPFRDSNEPYELKNLLEEARFKHWRTTGIGIIPEETLQRDKDEREEVFLSLFENMGLDTRETAKASLEELKNAFVTFSLSLSLAV